MRDIVYDFVIVAWMFTYYGFELHCIYLKKHVYQQRMERLHSIMVGIIIDIEYTKSFLYIYGIMQNESTEMWNKCIV